MEENPRKYDRDIDSRIKELKERRKEKIKRQQQIDENRKEWEEILQGKTRKNKDSRGMENARNYCAQLKVMERHCSDVSKELGECLKHVKIIQNDQKVIIGNLVDLHNSCQQLWNEQYQLRGNIENLSTPLRYFDDVESTAITLGVDIQAADPFGDWKDASVSPPSLTPEHNYEAFQDLLLRIEKNFKYFEEHGEFKDAELYRNRLAFLRTRAHKLIKSRLVKIIEECVAEIDQAKLGSMQILEDGSEERDASQIIHTSKLNLEVSPIYSKFMASSALLNQLVSLFSSLDAVYEYQEELVDVSSRTSTQEALESCQRYYLDRRLEIILPLVKEEISSNRMLPDLISCARQCVSLLLTICGLESRLYYDIFGTWNTQSIKANTDAFDKATETTSLKVQRSLYQRGSEESQRQGEKLFEMFENLWEYVSSALRPLFIRQQDVDVLCDLITVLRDELGQEVNSVLRYVRTPSGRTGTKPFTFEDDDILSTPKNVLTRVVADAQERLIFCTQKLLREKVDDFKPTALDIDYPAVLLRYHAYKSGLPTSPMMKSPSQASSFHMGIYDTWYRPLRVTLELLSKIYRIVDIGVFEDIAQAAVSHCTKGIGVGGNTIHSERFWLDGDLFAIKHLLILREQLSPFDIQFLSIEKHLDFSSTTGALSKFMTERSKLFRLGSDNAFLHLAINGFPNVKESQVDARKNIEDDLKSYCKHLIDTSIDIMTKSIEEWLTLAQSFVGENEEGFINGATPYESLKNQSFSTVKRLEDHLNRTKDTLADFLPKLTKRLAIYLENPLTQRILFRPIQRHFVERTSFLRNILEKIFSMQEFVAISTLLNEVTGTISNLDMSENKITPEMIESLKADLKSSSSSIPSDLEQTIEGEPVDSKGNDTTQEAEVVLTHPNPLEVGGQDPPSPSPSPPPPDSLTSSSVE